MTDFTFVTCSYNTPEVTLAMLKSFAHYHRHRWPVSLLIMENSTLNATAELLDLHSIPYVRAPGTTHSVAMDKALHMIRTEYAVVGDTDVVFRSAVDPLLENLRQRGATLMGEWQGDRAGFRLHPRIAPFFMVLNARNIQHKQIRYHDDVRIDATGSRGFYEMRETIPNPARRFYDVGATFLEDVLAAGLTAEPINDLGRYLYHATALSWGPTSDERAQAHVRRTNKIFWELAAATAQVDLRGAYRDFAVG